MALDQSWRPNWMDLNLGVYPDHGDDLRAWAWEFIRRNPAYQADYERWAALPDDDGEGNYSLKYGGTFCEDESMSYFVPLPGIDPLDGETAGDYEKRTGQWVITLHDHFSIVWHIHEPTAPSSSSAPAYAGEEPVPPYCVGSIPEEFILPSQFAPLNITKRAFQPFWPEEIDADVHVLGFDLRFNIEEQLEAAKKMLIEARDCEPLWSGKKQKVKRPSEHRGTYEAMLRYLDAVAAGASSEQIRDKLNTSESTIANNAMEACDEEIRLEKAANKWLDDLKNKCESMQRDDFKRLLMFGDLERSQKDKKRREKAS